ncbi:uncharacterized protein LOC130629426 [Hydractinia symbiolongicarpus]|uniref:uncharacterized protein LOC130629426 n=1 Tax=Hydractinia symbiolongicarpus TaxID=13093 RepID=UPI00254B6B65|nr:uncharacterized protein LOC130629426 [Hydractinia symbiolongicarpus]
MHKPCVYISTVLLCLASGTLAQLNCTNIPSVPNTPADPPITSLIASANENIVVCNQIIPFFNAFIASAKLPGVNNQIKEIDGVLSQLQTRIEIVNRRLNCGLVASVQEAQNLQQTLQNDLVSIRVLAGIRSRLVIIRDQLVHIIH